MKDDLLGGFRSKEEMFDYVDSFLKGIPEFQKIQKDNIIYLDQYKKNKQKALTDRY